jgi:hypothetical protein
MTDTYTVTQADRMLVEAIINDYHTTRVDGSDYVSHILGKTRTISAFARHRTEAIATLQSELAEARVWQPIETAPKDGEWLICWDGKKVQPLTWISDTYSTDYTGWAYGLADWGGTLYEGYNEVEREPTHWMPLPPPPKDTPHD